MVFKISYAMQADSEVINQKRFQTSCLQKTMAGDFQRKFYQILVSWLPLVLGKIKGRPHLSREISITFFTA